MHNSIPQKEQKNMDNSMNYFLKTNKQKCDQLNANNTKYDR